MKRKVFRIVSVFYSLTALVLILPTAALAGYAFWYGTDITENAITGDQADALHSFLTTPDNPVTEEIEGLGLPFGVFFPMVRGFNNKLPEENYGDVLVYKSGKTWDGYMLLSSIPGKPCEGDPDTNCGAILIDMNGNFVKDWPLNAFPAKMLPGGHVIGGKGTFYELKALPLVQLDWCGRQRWHWDGNPADAWVASQDFYSDPDGPGPAPPQLIWSAGDELISGSHHDFQRQGSPVGYFSPYQWPYQGGKTLILANYVPPIEETCPDPDMMKKIVSASTACMTKQFMRSTNIIMSFSSGLPTNIMTKWDLTMSRSLALELCYQALLMVKMRLTINTSITSTGLVPINGTPISVMNASTRTISSGMPAAAISRLLSPDMIIQME